MLALNRSEFADRRSPPCERALLVRIERREPGNELGKGIGGLALAGGGGQQIMPDLAHLQQIELRHCDPAADLELPLVRVFSRYCARQRLDFRRVSAVER